MNKILVVNHFRLPQELIDYICSFTFYTVGQVIDRNKKLFNEVVYDINSTYITCYCASSGSMYNMHRVVHITNPNLYGTHQIDIYVKLCMDCGEYYPRSKSKCKCY